MEHPVVFFVSLAQNRQSSVGCTLMMKSSSSSSSTQMSVSRSVSTSAHLFLILSFCFILKFHVVVGVVFYCERVCLGDERVQT